MDPQQQHAAHLLAGMGASFFLFIVLFALAVFVFVIYCLWRIFTKAGLSGALSLLIFVPGIGSIIVLCILAFANWKVVPVVLQYGALPPNYPPPPVYPPSVPPAQY